MFEYCLIEDEITIYKYEKKLFFDNELAEYLAVNNLIAGAVPLPDTE